MKTRLIIAAILFLNFTLQAQEANKKNVKSTTILKL